MKIFMGACALVLAATINAKPTLGSRQALIASNGTGRIHPVVVGGAQITIIPNQVNAAVGDTIQFQFANGAHTVTQSAENQPCVPLQNTIPSAVYSGRYPFQNGQQVVGTFNMPVTSTQPMFLYCSTGPHCQLGQVMVINPKDPYQIVNYAKAAAQATSNSDGKVVMGGTPGQIPLAQAAFVPALPPSGPPPSGKKRGSFSVFDLIL